MFMGLRKIFTEIRSFTGDSVKILSTTGSGSQSEYCKFFNIIKCGLLESLVL